MSGSVYIIGNMADYIFSYKSKELLIKEKPEIYKQSECYIKKNLLIISPIAYGIMDYSFLQKKIQFEMIKYCALLLTHNIIYFFIHREMHRNKSLKHIDNFHHEFDTRIIPSIGLAVTQEEFILAYITPFIVGGACLSPSELTFITSIITISILNMVIHTNELYNILWIHGVIAPRDHINHHRDKKDYYRAPLLNRDEIMDSYVVVV